MTFLRGLVGIALGGLLALALAPSALGITLADGDIVANDTLAGQVVRVDPDTGATSPIVAITSFPIQGIAVEADGKILVCGRGAGGGPGDFAKVIRIDPASGATQVLTSGGFLSQPLDVDVAPGGEIYAVDTATSGKVIRIDPDTGAQTLIAATPLQQAPGTLSAPRGIAVAGDGTLLVANRNTLDPGVLRLDPVPGATPTTVASGEPPFELPHGVAVEADEDIVVADPFVAPLAPGAQGGALIRVDPSTGATSTFMNGFAPLGIAVESDGTLALVSAGNAGVHEVDPSTGARTTLTPGITPTAVDVAEVNRPPVADDDLYAVEADSSLTIPADGVLANDSDLDGEPLTASLVDGPASGALDLGVDGGFTYTPPSGFIGDVTFTYRASDGQATSEPATVTLQVRDTAAPTVSIEQAVSQADPTNQSPILFDVVFSEPVTGFDADHVELGGSAAPTQVSVAGSGAIYTVSVDGMAGDGGVTASLAAGAARDRGGNPSAASTSSDNMVSYDASAPTVEVEQAATQADPTSQSPIEFAVAFSEPVVGLTTDDVILAGSASAQVATLSGSGPDYVVRIDVTSTGTVSASLPSGAAQDPAGNPNAASTSTDNTVSFVAGGPTVTIDQAPDQADPTSEGPIRFVVTFSEPVTGFDGEDVSLAGSRAAGRLRASVSGSGASYVVAVTGMRGDGVVVASIPAGTRFGRDRIRGAVDADGNLNAASTSTDNTVSFVG